MSENQAVEKTETKEERKARKAAKKQAKADKGGGTEESAPVEKKSKKRKAEIEPASTEVAATSTEPVQPVTQVEDTPSSSKKQKKDKKKNTKTSLTEATDESSIRPTETPTADSKDVEMTPAQPATGAEETSTSTPAPKKEKKSKKAKSAAAQAKVPAEITEEEQEKKKQEEEAEQEEVTEPGKDKSINEQSQKALQYAHIFKENKADPTVVWKFNKARQNWLLRNIWSTENIPERWVDLTINYLKTIQGVGKKNMIEDAKKRLETPKKDEPGVTSEAQPEAEIKADDAEETPAKTTPAETTEKTTDEAKEPEVDSEEQVAIKDRATRLLKALDVEA